MTRSTVWRLVPALGVTQIISWGTLYYSIAVLGASIREELGISSAALFGAYSLSLLISAVVAPVAGRAIDRYGGRAVMSVGSATAAVALFLISRVHSPLALYAAWGIAGLAMAMTMYDAAFATLSQHTGSRYRTALTALTLMGGLASTVFWPTSLKGLEWFGWRDTMVFFASGRAGAAPEAGTLPKRSRRGAFIALAIALALNGFIVSVLTVHLITVLQGKGLALETAVWVGSFFGPMQVTGRVVEFAFGRRFSSRAVGIAALLLLVAALVVLLGTSGSIALALVFAVLFGFSNGVVTIVRGTVPAELFGRAGYGSTLGNLAAPALFARAVAPFAFAPLAVPDTPSLVWLLMLLAMAVASVASFSIAVRRR
jgi:MFS family permease